MELLDNPTLAVRHKLREVLYVLAALAACEHVVDGFKGLGGVAFAAGEQAHGGGEFAELLGGEAAALQAYFVQAVGMVVALDGSERVRQYVLRDGGASADVSVAADAAVLVHGSVRA